MREEQVFEDDEQPDAQREREYDIGRLMAISDGVFAVAITLLVFNVPVPTIAQNTPRRGCRLLCWRPDRASSHSR